MHLGGEQGKQKCVGWCQGVLLGSCSLLGLQNARSLAKTSAGGAADSAGDACGRISSREILRPARRVMGEALVPVPVLVPVVKCELRTLPPETVGAAEHAASDRKIVAARAAPAAAPPSTHP